MSEKIHDCVVIGSGIAGFSAALHLKNRNRSVLILTKGPGATSVSSGAWDFGPSTPEDRSAYSQLLANPTWTETFKKAFPGSCPVIGAEETAREIARILAPELKLVASFDRPVFLPTSSGNWKKTYVAQGIHGNGSLESLRGKKVVLFSAQNFRFGAKQVAQVLQSGAKKLGFEVNLIAKEVPFFDEGSDYPLPHISARLGADAPFQSRFIDWAMRNIRPMDVDVLLFPPLFPSQKSFDALQSKVGGIMAELLCVGEPIAGYRLWNAIESTLKKMSISKIPITSIESIETRDRTILGLAVIKNDGSKETIRAKQFLLCTGKFFGGGITLGFNDIYEGIFGAPVFVPGEKAPVTLRSQGVIKNADFFESQTWSGIGVHVNDQWQPVDGLNLPVYDNLRACGSVLGGVDFATQGFGLGFMACTGREAALVLS